MQEPTTNPCIVCGEQVNPVIVADDDGPGPLVHDRCLSKADDAREVVAIVAALATLELHDFNQDLWMMDLIRRAKRAASRFETGGQ